MIPPAIKFKYYNKAKLLYKISFLIFIWLILFSQIVNQINAIIGAILIVLPFIGEYVIVPLGLIYLIKSFTNKEPFHRYRIFYLIGYIFFIFIEVLFTLAFIGDIRYYMFHK